MLVWINILKRNQANMIQQSWKLRHDTQVYCYLKHAAPTCILGPKAYIGEGDYEAVPTARTNKLLDAGSGNNCSAKRAKATMGRTHPTATASHVNEKCNGVGATHGANQVRKGTKK